MSTANTNKITQNKTTIISNTQHLQLSHTQLLYLAQSYLTTAQATVHQVQPITESKKQDHIGLILDQTIFYPQGGGQPADHGVIIGPHGQLHVSHVSYNQGAVLHQGQLEGEIKPGEVVELQIEWEHRYRHMQLHTAGHILDQAVKNVLPQLRGIEGDHGLGKRCFVEFDGVITPDQLAVIQTAVNAIIAAQLPITAEMVTAAQIAARQIALPFALPQNKDLRLVQIGDYPPMPDGGTQLKNTGEAWPITVTGLVEKQGHTRLTYAVTAPAENTQADKSTVTNNTTDNSFSAAIAAAQKQIATLITHNDPNRHTKIFGKKQGIFTQLAKQMRALPDAHKQAAGRQLNELKTQIQAQLESLVQNHSTHSTTWQDPTLPPYNVTPGHLHPLTQAIREITDIFTKIGFTRVRYPEVDWDWYAFGALNMPTNHPARDEWETFFVDAPAHHQYGKMVLTPHTSNGQVREMERLRGKPPIRMINIARTYRRQQDATHTQMFHQFEGLVVDRGITIQHLKGTIDYFAQQFYGPEATSRIRPFHFKFTEPSFEVDFSCTICHGTGRLDNEKCRFCKSGWHEVGGAGMVHPNVLHAGGIDPNEYTGFAFGWGIERTYALRPGLHLDDIRLLYSADPRFLQQF